MCTFGENTSKYCSRTIVVHVHATGFLKVHPACTVSNQEMTLKTKKPAADMLGLKVIFVRCMNCS